MMAGGQFGDTKYRKVFVGGLAWETPKEIMREYFAQFGEILEAVVITDKNTGRSKGYGFVTFRDEESAIRACRDPSPFIDGRRANCNLAYLGVQRSRPYTSGGGATPRYRLVGSYQFPQAPIGIQGHLYPFAGSLPTPAFSHPYPPSYSFPYQTFGYPPYIAPDTSFQANILGQYIGSSSNQQMYSNAGTQFYQYYQIPQVMQAPTPYLNYSPFFHYSAQTEATGAPSPPPPPLVSATATPTIPNLQHLNQYGSSMLNTQSSMAPLHSMTLALQQPSVYPSFPSSAAQQTSSEPS